MGASAVFDVLSKRAPVIVVVTLITSLFGAWSKAPDWLFNALAIVVGSLALLLWAARGLPRQFKSKEDLGFTRNRDFVAHELAGKGTPRGSYLLGFFGFATILVSGFQTPYGTLAFAGLALSVVWGIVNTRYPSDWEASGH